MTDIVGRTLGAGSLERQIAKTLHRHRLGVSPGLVSNLANIGSHYRRDISRVLRQHGIAHEELEAELIDVFEECYE